jgi:serine/threonine protein kinase
MMDLQKWCTKVIFLLPFHCLSFSPFSSSLSFSSYSQLTLSSCETADLLQNKLFIPYDELQILSLLGSGSFGNVYEGKWEGSKVAIKCCKIAQQQSDFLREANLMVNLRPHPNVVTVLGVSIKNDSPTDAAIVMEYCNGGMSFFLTLLSVS